MVVFAILALMPCLALADEITMQYGGSLSSIPGPLCSANEGENYYWSDKLAPQKGNSYSTTMSFRTPIDNSGTSWTFEGDSIDLNAAGGVLIKTLLPSTLTFANEMRVSWYGVFKHNQGLPGAADLTAQKFSLARVQFYPCSGSYEGGIHLHGPVVSDEASVARASHYIQIYGDVNFPSTFVDFDGDCSGFYGQVLVFANATLTGTSGFPNASSVRLDPDSTLSVKSTGFAANVLDTTTGGSGERTLIFDSSSGYLGTFSLSGGMNKFTGPLTIRVSDMSRLSAGGEYTLVASENAFGVGSFVVDPSITNAVPQATLTVAADRKSISLLIRPAVAAVKDGVVNATGDGYVWDDASGSEPMPGKDYLVDGAAVSRTVTTPVASTSSYPKFLGDALFLLGSGAALGVEEPVFEVPNLIVGSGSHVNFSGSKATELSGGIRVAGDDASAPVHFRAYNNRTGTLSAELSGSGRVWLCGMGPISSGPGAIIDARGLNTNYTGRLTVCFETASQFNGEEYEGAVGGRVAPALHTWYYYETLMIADARTLGGDRSTFAHDGLKLTHMSLLYPTSSMTFGAKNRGICISEYGRVQIDSGRTLTIMWPITYDGIFRKEGQGHLAIGAKARFGLNDNLDDVTMPTAGRNQFRVVGGTIQSLTAEAYQGLSLRFSADTGIVVDPLIADLDAKRLGVCVGASGEVVATGETIPVTILGTDETLPTDTTVGILTMPDNAASREIGSKLVVNRIRGRRVEISPVTDSEKGTVTYQAHVYKSGFIMSLR